MESPIVIELEDNRQDHELSLSANKPSFILFVDRSSGSLEDRRKSMKALCTFRGRLENLEVMSKHGPELWRQNNHRLEVFLTRMQKLAHGQNEEIEKVNRERKYHQVIILWSSLSVYSKPQRTSSMLYLKNGDSSVSRRWRFSLRRHKSIH